MTSALQNYPEPTTREKPPWYMPLTTEMLSLPFCIRHEKTERDPNFCTSRARSLWTSSPPPLSVIGEGRQMPLGWYDGQRGQIRWTVLRKFPPAKPYPPNQGLNATNGTGKSKVYSWPGARVGDTVHLPLADVCSSTTANISLPGPPRVPMGLPFLCENQAFTCLLMQTW